MVLNYYAEKLLCCLVNLLFRGFELMVLSILMVDFRKYLIACCCSNHQMLYLIDWLCL